MTNSSRRCTASSQPICSASSRADVASGEDHLECAPAAEKMRESGGPAGAGQDPHRDLGLAEHRPFAPVAEVQCREELGTTATGRAVDHADRHQTTAVQALEQCRGDVGFGGGHVLARRDGEDAVHVTVHEEEVGIGAREHDDADAVVRFEVVEQCHQRADERTVDQVGWRVVDHDLGNTR